MGSEPLSRVRRARYRVFTLLVLGLTTSQVFAAEPESEISAVRFDKPPTIDGKLEDRAWESAAEVEGFLQVQPVRGEPSPALTTVLLGYDDEALFVAFRCQDDNAQQIAHQRGTSDLGEESKQGNTLFAKISWVF